MPDDAFENAHAKLDEWNKGQGYAIESYLGGRDAMRSSLKTPSGDAQMLPTKEKLTERGKFDPEGVLFCSAALGLCGRLVQEVTGSFVAPRGEDGRPPVGSGIMEQGAA